MRKEAYTGRGWGGEGREGREGDWRGGDGRGGEGRGGEWRGGNEQSVRTVSGSRFRAYSTSGTCELLVMLECALVCVCKIAPCHKNHPTTLY